MRNRLKRLVNSGPALGLVVTSVSSGTMPPVLVPHEEQPELLRILAELRFGLQIDLVDAAEPVEVVDVGAAEQRAERRVHVVQRHAGLEHLAAIDVGVDLRHGRAIERVDAPDLRPLARGLHEPRVCCARYSGDPPLRSWSCIVNPAPVPRPGMAGGPERDDARLGDLLRERPVQRRDHAVGVRSSVVPVVPRLELHEEEAHVRGVGAGQQRVAGDGVEALDGLVLRQDRLGLLHDRIGALERGRVGQQRVDQQIALILLRHEAARNALDERERSRSTARR